MAATTLTVELKSPARKDGTRALRIRITKFRQHAYWNLGKYVLPAHWNKKLNVKLQNYIVGHQNAKQLNHAIKTALRGLEKVADALPAATAAGIKQAYEKALRPEEETQPQNFHAFAAEYIQRLKDQNYKSGHDFGYEWEQFKNIVGGNLPFAELFSLKSLYRYRQELKTLKNGPGSILAKINRIRRIYNAGLKSKLFPDLGNLFQEVKVRAPKKKKIRPTAEMISQFFAYQPKNQIQAMAKTVATLQYLLQGARVGEAIVLSWANIQANHVEYLPQKGATRPKFIPRSKMLNNLLSELPRSGRYVLPYIGEDYPTLPPKQQHYRKANLITKINKGLKEISENLKFDIVITSHMLRHAFADAVIATGSNVHVAAALLGHANPRTTEQYIKDLQLEDVSAVSLSIFDALEGKQ